MPRTIIVGDLHGCREELEDLLAWVGFATGDRLISVGDVVVRGPDPHGTVTLLRKTGARAVRGNHEDRLLRWLASRDKGRADPPLGQLARRAVDALRPRDWEWLSGLPLWIDLPEHEVRVVHAGVLPGVPIAQQDPRTLLFMRSIDEHGRPVAERGGPSWAHRWPGPEHVVFGHHAKEEPEIAEHATGIDTGCVYGGRLTAMVLREGERPPPPAERQSVLVSVPARRVWCPK
jgi:hypothetical protein